jgi:hypothetical protein
VGSINRFPDTIQVWSAIKHWDSRMLNWLGLILDFTGLGRLFLLATCHQYKRSQDDKPTISKSHLTTPVSFILLFDGLHEVSTIAL